MSENSTIINVIDRNEILFKRRERRLLKKQENKDKRYHLQREKLLNKTTDKLNVVDIRTFEKLLEINNNTQKELKQSPSFDLLDFVIKKEKSVEVPTKSKKSDKIISLKKKKKQRDIPLKRHTSNFKKIIIEARVLRKKNIESKANLGSFEKLNLTDERLEEKSPQEYISIEAPKSNELCVIEEKLKCVSLDETKKNKNIFSRKFRPYCDNLTTKQLRIYTEQLLKDLFRFQKRAYEKNEIKGRYRRRYIVGFKEVLRKIEINKLKLLIIAPDCEACELPDGIEAVITQIKNKCKEDSIPYFFSLLRFQLGRLLFKKVPISCVGIIDYDGCTEIVSEILKSLEEARKEFFKATN